MSGRYVPPHLRNRPAASSPSASPAQTPSRPPRQPWSSDSPSHSGVSSPRRNDANGSPSSNQYRPNSHGQSPRNPQGDSHGSAYPNSPGNHQGSRRDGLTSGRASSRSLYVFGDSFVGPFKLLADTNAKVQTFKGSSAKGLNNPNSIKQVSSELVPLLNNLLAPPPYAYLPPTGRYALLIFGNVDLQINYIWQLQHKPIGPSTFGTGSESESDTHASSAGRGNGDAAGVPPSSADDILATATENAGRGPALGPDRFVDTVLGAYTAWLEREVVHGPIGRRAEAVAADHGAAPGSGSPASTPPRGPRRPLAPTRILVAGALPPLVEDAILPRIPEKYVERLEEDHARAHRALERGERERGSRTPWAAKGGASAPDSGSPCPSSPAPPSETDDIERGLASTSISSSPSASDTPRPDKDKESKTSVADLLAHDPPLCTKPVRIAMTTRYNDGLRAFCERYPNVLSFVDIGDAMLALDAAERESERNGRGNTGGDESDPSFEGEVDRARWACPIDPSNIHPLWEPTLPLWFDALSPLGVPTQSFKISEDAEETFKAYEEDKRRRMNPLYADDGERIKLRDE